jgi:hypothetical protein
MERFFTQKLIVTILSPFIGTKLFCLTAMACLLFLFSSTTTVHGQAGDAAFTTNLRNVPLTKNGANFDKKILFSGTQYFKIIGTGVSTTYCTGSSFLQWSANPWTAGALTQTTPLSIFSIKWFVNLVETRFIYHLVTSRFNGRLQDDR